MPLRPCLQVLFSLLLLVLPRTGLGAPANDNFADAIEVFHGSTNSVTGSNAGATTEAGEIIPDGYSASSYSGTIWYVFRPASSSSGFLYEVNTVGSAIDTVVAVWTGTGFNDMQLVQVNDEAVEGGVSRVRFAGLADASYYISVAGRSPAARGSITLTVLTGGPQMITSVDSPNFSPASVDVSTAAASTTFAVTLSVSANIAAGYVHLYSPARALVASSTYSVANRVSGSNNSGVYNIVLTVPRYLAPGNYLVGFEAQDNVNNTLKSDSFGWDQMSALSSLPTLTVQNTGAMDLYSQFTSNNGLSGASAALTADPDKDGVNNLEEFAFGLDPNAINHASVVVTGGTLTARGLPVAFLAGTGSQQRLRVEFIRRTDLSPLTYQVEFSDDLVHWSAATNSPVVQATAGGFEAVTVDDVITGAARSKRFAHVVMTYQLQ